MRSSWAAALVLAAICAPATSGAQEVAEAANSCVVVHESAKPDGEKSLTCFENIGLERTAFESGVCRWNTESQAAANVTTTTKFVARCPTSYSAYCDRLVLDPKTIAPVKIFLYDQSESVLERAARQCRSGGGNWHAALEPAEKSD